MKTGNKAPINKALKLDHFFFFFFTCAQKAWIIAQPNASQILRDAIDLHMQRDIKEFKQEV